MKLQVTTFITIAIASAIMTGSLMTVSAHDCTVPPCYEIETDVASTIDAGSIEYKFQIIDEVANAFITDQELDLFHEKLLHFIIFDPALMEYQHVHPEFKDGNWVVALNLLVNGRYWIYVQGKSKELQKEFTINTRLAITNGSQANAVVLLGEQRIGASGDSVVTITNDKLRANQMAMPLISFSRSDGTTPVLTPYLGALAHVVIAGDSGKSFLHVHPMDSNLPNQFMLHTTFPHEGSYRVWVEFIDGGILKRVPLSVTVGP
ncbi:MAG: hypothetical protein HQK50_08835 [Oligoflexia bacterium]|nr:hypothetical protein [Oligoflexia bacterium]MBF0365664.1 hypothetical protein [Oligoflexia bacterium]